MVGLKYKTIPVGDIQADGPVRENPRSTEKLFNSIRNNGLRQPLLVNPADLKLISGFRRFAAYRSTRRISVQVAFPADVQEACTELGDHVTAPDAYALPMTHREQVALAARLRELPKPPGHRDIRHDLYIAPALGMPAAVLQRLRSAYRMAVGDDPDLEASAVRNAQQVLDLMLQVVERPPDGWTTGQAIRLLHPFLKAGGCPASLEAVCATARQTREAAPGAGIPAQAGETYVPDRGMRRPVYVEVRRGIDTISGACAGLASLSISEIPADQASYVEREIKSNQRILREILKTIQGK
jgi:hypothetical protein